MSGSSGQDKGVPKDERPGGLPRLRPEPAKGGLGHSAGIPDALKEALGGIVSMCADARGVFPDSQTALDGVTEAVNELYACVEGGVFGPALLITREDVADFCSAVLADNMPRRDEPFRTIAFYINAGRRRAYAAGLAASATGARSAETSSGSGPQDRQSGDAEGSATPKGKTP